MVRVSLVLGPHLGLVVMVRVSLVLGPHLGLVVMVRVGLVLGIHLLVVSQISAPFAPLLYFKYMLFGGVLFYYFCILCL